MTMFATSQTSRGKSRARRSSVVHDAGGLVLGQTIQAQWMPGEPMVPGRDEERPGAVIAALTPADVATVIRIAARAPSVHNTQPWRFRVVGDVIELLADPDRLLTQVDPAGREMTISCGAALFGLRLGLRQLGRVPAVRLWPDPAQPWLLARVWPAEHAAVNTIETELLAAVPHRHTHREPFTPGEVPTRLLAALAVDAAAEGAELRFIESADLLSALVTLVNQAAADQNANAAISAETRRWLRPAGIDASDGVPERATPVSNEPTAQRFRQRQFGPETAAKASVCDGPNAADITGEPPTATAVLVTVGDTADDWLRAGQALDRLLLRAATRWVFASLQTQPLESPRYRNQVRDLLALPGQPQILLQFGRANTALATPRRPQAEYRTNENRPQTLSLRHTGSSALLRAPVAAHRR
jgi:hypothetical protein